MTANNEDGIDLHTSQVMVGSNPTVIVTSDEDGETAEAALLRVCLENQLDDLKALLENNTEVIHTLDNDNRNVLHHCSQVSSLDCIELILEESSNLVNQSDEAGLTPLHVSVQAGNIPLVKLLLRKGADIKAVDHERHTVAHWATGCGHVELLDTLIKYGASLSNQDIHGVYPIHYAVQMVHLNSEQEEFNVGIQLLWRLLAKEVDVNAVDQKRRPPLTWAAIAGNTDACKLLINKGADVNQGDTEGVTALHCAVSRGHTRCAEVLVRECNAMVDPEDEHGSTPLFYAITLGRDGCVLILLEMGADPSHQDKKGRSPAHCAAKSGSRTCMEWLQQKHANIWLKSEKEELPLHECAWARHNDLVEYLLDTHDDPDAVDYTSANGRTCLHIAAILNNTELCDLLIEKGANVNAVMMSKDKFHYTAYDAAQIKGHTNTRALLQSHGAKSGSQVNNKNTIDVKVTPKHRGRPSSGRKSEKKSPSKVNKLEVINPEKDKGHVRNEAKRGSREKKMKGKKDENVEQDKTDGQPLQVHNEKSSTAEFENEKQISSQTNSAPRTEVEHHETNGKDEKNADSESSNSDSGSDSYTSSSSSESGSDSDTETDEVVGTAVEDRSKTMKVVEKRDASPTNKSKENKAPSTVQEKTINKNKNKVEHSEKKQKDSNISGTLTRDSDKKSSPIQTTTEDKTSSPSQTTTGDGKTPSPSQTTTGDGKTPSPSQTTTGDGKQSSQTELRTDPDNTEPMQETENAATTKEKKISEKKKKERSDKILIDVRASVKRYYKERQYAMQQHQLRRAQIYSSPLYDIVLFRRASRLRRRRQDEESGRKDQRKDASSLRPQQTSEDRNKSAFKRKNDHMKHDNENSARLRNKEEKRSSDWSPSDTRSVHSKQGYFIGHSDDDNRVEYTNMTYKQIQQHRSDEFRKRLLLAYQPYLQKSAFPGVNKNGSLRSSSRSPRPRTSYHRKTSPSSSRPPRARTAAARTRSNQSQQGANGNHGDNTPQRASADNYDNNIMQHGNARNSARNTSPNRSQSNQKQNDNHAEQHNEDTLYMYTPSKQRSQKRTKPGCYGDTSYERRSGEEQKRGNLGSRRVQSSRSPGDHPRGYGRSPPRPPTTHTYRSKRDRVPSAPGKQKSNSSKTIMTRHGVVKIRDLDNDRGSADDAAKADVQEKQRRQIQLRRDEARLEISTGRT